MVAAQRLTAEFATIRAPSNPTRRSGKNQSGRLTGSWRRLSRGLLAAFILRTAGQGVSIFSLNELVGRGWPMAAGVDDPIKTYAHFAQDQQKVGTVLIQQDDNFLPIPGDATWYSRRDIPVSRELLCHEYRPGIRTLEHYRSQRLPKASVSRMQ